MNVLALLRPVALAVLLLALPQVATAQSIFVELLRPQSDDLGHYMPTATAGSYPVLGVVASQQPVARVSVAGVPAVLFPVNTYRVFGAPDAYPVVGFRTRLFLEPFTPLRVTVVDQDGNLRDAAYLPDGANTLQRLQFLYTYRPLDPLAQLRIANANIQAGNVDLAAPVFDTVVANNPDFGVARHLRALALLDTGRTDAGLADLEWLADNVPDAMAPRLDLAIALHDLGYWAEAIDEYYAVLDLAPGAAEAHLLLGQALRESGGNLVEASLQQELALEDAPSLADPQYELGLIEASRGDYDGAVHRFQQSVQMNPRNADAQLGLAMSHYQRGNYRRAWLALDRAARWGAQIDPAFVDALADRHPGPRRPGGIRTF